MDEKAAGAYSIDVHQDKEVVVRQIDAVSWSHCRCDSVDDEGPLQGIVVAY